VTTAKVARLISWIDLFVVVAACAVPLWFVEGAAKLSTQFGLNRPAIAYAFIVALVTFGSSLIRRWDMASVGRREAIADAFVALVGLYMLLSIGAGDANASVAEITSPYLSYVISVLFSAGVGYALAGLFVYLTQGLKGKETSP
jgi:hypothetical protein